MNVLISSAGRRVGLVNIFREVFKVLGHPGRVVAADMGQTAAACHVADDWFTVPRCTEAAFIEVVARECVQRDVGLIIPTIDTELLVYARAREALARQGIRVAVSAPAVIGISGDKRRTHEWLCEHSFPTVKQWNLREVLDGSVDVTYPVVAKPRFGSAGVGVVVARGRAALEGICSDFDYIVQEQAPGVEYTVDCWVDSQGTCRSVIPRRRLEVRGGEVSKGVTVWHDELQSTVRKIVMALPGARGVLNVQAFVDESGRIAVIEVNPRFGGGYPLAWAAGARYAEWLVREVLGMPGPSDEELMGWAKGLMMLRYDDAVFLREGYL